MTHRPFRVVVREGGPSTALSRAGKKDVDAVAKPRHDDEGSDAILICSITLQVSNRCDAGFRPAKSTAIFLFVSLW